MLDALTVTALSVLSGLGVGGGGLGVLYFALLRGMEQRAAQGLNLLIFICASASALAVNFRKRRLDAPSLAVAVAVGCPAALLGSILANALDGHTVRRLFGGFLLCLGIRAMLKRRD